MMVTEVKANTQLPTLTPLQKELGIKVVETTTPVGDTWEVYVGKKIVHCTLSYDYLLTFLRSLTDYLEAFTKSEAFIEYACQYCRDEGWRDPDGD